MDEKSGINTKQPHVRLHDTLITLSKQRLLIATRDIYQ
jgi:hypothetical protein